MSKSTVPGVLRSKVFVGCIPATTDEGTVKSTLGLYGKVIGFFYCRDMMNGDRGFALVTFSTETEALNCVNCVHGTQVFENSVRPVYGKLSCEKITDLTGSVFADPGRPLPSSFWEEYTSDEGYPYYHNRETGETVWEKPRFFVAPEPIATVISPVQPVVGGIQNSGYGPLGANLFIFHVPAEWKDEDLRKRFEQFGQLVSCKISIDDSGRPRGFGFVGFTTRESAANAIQAMNGLPVAPGKYLKVTVKQGEEEYAVSPTAPPPAQAQAGNVSIQHVLTGSGLIFQPSGGSLYK
jgi:CUG-BP- and ETR3-like factor